MIHEIDYDSLLKKRPDLKGQEYSYKFGWNGFVCIFDNEAIKAPRIGNVKKEISILRMLNQTDITFAPRLLSVAFAPRMFFTAKKEIFYSMQKMPGTDLMSAFDSMTDTQKEKLKQEYATHKIEIEEKLENFPLSVETESLKNTHSILQLPEVQYKLDNLGVKDTVSTYLEKFNKRKPIPIHGDLHAGNILVDEDTKAITAILDWDMATKTKAYEWDFRRMYVTHKFHGGLPREFMQESFNLYCKDSKLNCEETDLASYSILTSLTSLYNSLSSGDKKRTKNLQDILGTVEAQRKEDIKYLVQHKNIL